MKKPSSKIREEIARLQDQLKQAETREAERIGRIALKAGLGKSRSTRQSFRLPSRTSPNGFAEAKGVRPGRMTVEMAEPQAGRPRRSRLARMRAGLMRFERMAKGMTTEARKKRHARKDRARWSDRQSGLAL